MAQEKIKLTKTIYSAKSTEGLIDRSFSEFFKTKDPINLDRFFSIYGELFYDIPKTGAKSHTSIIKQSKDYVKNYNDVKDDQITILTNRIAELEEQLNSSKEEHPFFPNGTLLVTDDNESGTPDGDEVYYMDRGVKRRIANKITGEVYQALRAALGFPSTTPDDQIYKIISKNVLNGIDEGTVLDIEDITGQNLTLEEEIQTIENFEIGNWEEELAEIPNFNNGVYTENKKPEFIRLLKDLIINEFERESNLETLFMKYQEDSLYGFTQDEKDRGATLLSLIQPKINLSRSLLVILKRIWQQRNDFPNINFSTFLPPSIPITTEEIELFISNKGMDEFPGISDLIGVVSGEYDIPYNGEYLDIPYKSSLAYQLLDEKLILLKYEKQKYKPFKGGWQFDKIITRYNHSDYQGGLLERYIFRGYQYR